MAKRTFHLNTRRIRLVLHTGETFRIPPGRFEVQVLTGTAWLTQAGVDHVIPAHGLARTRGARDTAVLSGAGVAPLQVEIRRADHGAVAARAPDETRAWPRLPVPAPVRAGGRLQ